LEEPEEDDPLAVKLVVVAIEDGGDAAHVPPYAARHEELHLPVPEEGVLVLEDLRDVGAEGRHPVRVARVDGIGDVEESLEVALAAADSVDGDAVSAHRGSGSGSTTARSAAARFRAARAWPRRPRGR